MRRRLTELLGDLNSLLVSRWLNDPKENPDEIGETVGLMLQVVASLEGEVDVFIGSVDAANAAGAKAGPQTSAEPEETELADLGTDEPIGSLLKHGSSVETSALAEGSN